MNVTVATIADFDKITEWLKEEHNQNGEGFSDNIDLIKNKFEENSLFVIKGNSNNPVAFITGPIHSPSFLSVKTDYRGQGYGKILAQFVVQKARDQKLSVVEVLCAPETSIPFWENLGFEAFGNDEREKKFRWLVLKYEHLLKVGKDVDLCIRIFPESKLYQKDTSPRQEFRPLARKTTSGIIYLDQRITFIQTQYDKDVVIEIEIDQKRVCLKKAKSDVAKRLGIEKEFCSGAFYIDKIKDVDSTPEHQ